MGRDSVTPFLEFKNKWVILLALTSNQGSNDFQMMNVANDEDMGISIQHTVDSRQEQPLFKEVLLKSQQWGTAENLMYVVGATHPEMFAEIRKIVPDHFLLVPGIGAQGGNLEEVSRAGMNNMCGLLVNSSRQIIYASSSENFAMAAAAEAKKVSEEMKKYLNKIPD
jgi:orotidine-5'-phosphate decarboxylase